MKQAAAPILILFGLALLHGVVLEQCVRAEMLTVIKAPVLISKAKSDGTSENNRAGKTGGNGGTRNTDNTNRVGGSNREDGTNRVGGAQRGDGTSDPGTPRTTDGTGAKAPTGDGTNGAPKGDGTN